MATKRNIETRLNQSGKTMYQLAQEIEESPQMVHYFVKSRNFSKDYVLLKKIAAALGCGIEDLIDNDPEG